ncbi:MAG: FkbM family methyltransferase, partial [Saprospiraceae bacterium]
MNSYKHKIFNEPKVFYKFLRAFGVRSGLELYLQFKLRRVQHLNLPGIVHAINLRKSSSDLNVFYQIFLDSNEDFLASISEPKVIIDGGANIGLNTIKLKSKFPKAKIICVEPDGDNFKCLEKNTMNYDNIYLENCGLWNKDIDLKISDKFGMGKWSMVVEEVPDHGNVRGITIQSLMNKYKLERIDLLKLDIETSEKQLFSENYSSWLPLVGTIVIELHDHLTEGCSK